MNPTPGHTETHKLAAAVGQPAYTDEQLLPQQWIEAGGPPRRVDLNTLPGPIAYIGYAIVYGIPALFLGLIVAVTFFK